MKRREAIKQIGLTAGFVAVTPSIISLLQSCTSETSSWTPVFFTQEQGVVIRNLVDVMLPKTDTPSATEVNVPEFMDKFFDEVLEVKDQDRVRAGLDTLVATLKTDYNDNLSKLTEDNYKDLLDNKMIVGKDREPTPESEPLSVSDVLNQIKYLAIWAYTKSEIVGETVLVYDPVPAAHYCGDLEELTGGKSWSLP